MDNKQIIKQIRKVSHIVVFLLLVLTLISAKANAQLIISISDDTYTNQISKNANYGNYEYTQVSYTTLYNEITYLQFDFRDLKHYLLDSVQEINFIDLCIYPTEFSNPATQGFNITFIALNKPFMENTLTYNFNYRDYWVSSKNFTYNLRADDLNNFVCVDIQDLIVNEVDDDFKVVIVTDSNAGEYLRIRTKEFGSGSAYVNANFIEKLVPISIDKYQIGDSLVNTVFLFVMVFAYLGVNIIGFMFNNFGFASLGFFIGIFIGFMLSSFSIFMTFAFLFLNIAIFYGFSKNKKR